MHPSWRVALLPTLVLLIAQLSNAIDLYNDLNATHALFADLVNGVRQTDGSTIADLASFNGTVLAPSDAAINAYLNSRDLQLSSLSSNQKETLLNYHLVLGHDSLSTYTVYYPRGGCGGSDVIRKLERAGSTVQYSISDVHNIRGNTTVADQLNTSTIGGDTVIGIDAVLDPGTGSVPSNVYTYLQNKGGFERFLQILDATAESTYFQDYKFKGILFVPDNEALASVDLDSLSGSDLSGTATYHVHQDLPDADLRSMAASYADLSSAEFNGFSKIITTSSGWNVRVRVTDANTVVVDDISGTGVGVPSAELFWNNQVVIIQVGRVLSTTPSSAREAIVNADVRALLNVPSFTEIAVEVSERTSAGDSLTGTILLPTDAAVNNLTASMFPTFGQDSMEALFADGTFVQQLLDAHMVPGTTDLKSTSSDHYSSYDDADLPSELRFPLIRVDRDITFKNGGRGSAYVEVAVYGPDFTLLIIDAVLIPPMMQSNMYNQLRAQPQLSQLVSAIDTVPKLRRELLLATTGTLLAPNNAAIENFSLSTVSSDDAKEVLLRYHMPSSLEIGDVATDLGEYPKMNINATTPPSDSVIATSVASTSSSPLESTFPRPTSLATGRYSYKDDTFNVIPIDTVLTPFMTLGEMLPQSSSREYQQSLAGQGFDGLGFSAALGLVGTDLDGVVFVPSDTAFENLNQTAISDSMSEAEVNQYLVGFHRLASTSIVPEATMSVQVRDTPRTYLNVEPGMAWLSPEMNDMFGYIYSSVVGTLYTNTSRFVFLDRVMVPPQNHTTSLYDTLSGAADNPYATLLALMDKVPAVAAQIKRPAFRHALLAPTNDNIGLGSLAQGSVQATEILQYHIVDGNLTESFMLTPTYLFTLSDSYRPLVLNTTSSTLYGLTGSQAVSADEIVTLTTNTVYTDMTVQTEVLPLGDFFRPALSESNVKATIEALYDADGATASNVRKQVMAGAKGSLSGDAYAYDAFLDAADALGLLPNNLTGTILQPRNTYLPAGFGGLSERRRRQVLSAHIIPGTINVLTDGETYSTSAEGVSLYKVPGNDAFSIIEPAIGTGGGGDAENNITVYFDANVTTVDRDIRIIFVNEILMPRSARASLWEQVAALNSATVSPGYSTLMTAVERIDNLEAALKDVNTNAFLGAPSNQAFQTFLTAQGAESLSNVDLGTLEAVLSYHVVPTPPWPSLSDIYPMASSLPSLYMQTEMGSSLLAKIASGNTVTGGTCVESDVEFHATTYGQDRVVLPATPNSIAPRIMQLPAVLNPEAESMTEAILRATYHQIGPRSGGLFSSSPTSYNQMLDAISVLGLDIDAMADVGAVVVPADALTTPIAERLPGNYTTFQSMSLAAKNGNANARNALTELLSRHLLNSTVATFAGSQSASAISTKAPSGITVVPAYDSTGRLMSLSLSGENTTTRPGSAVSVQGFAYTPATKRVIFVDGLLEAVPASAQSSRRVENNIQINADNITNADLTTAGEVQTRFKNGIINSARDNIGEGFTYAVENIRAAGTSRRALLDANVDFTLVITGLIEELDNAVVRWNAGREATRQSIADALGVDVSTITLDTDPVNPDPDNGASKRVWSVMFVIAAVLLVIWA